MSKSAWKVCIETIKSNLTQLSVEVKHQENPWVVGVSGGMDSMALLHTLMEIYPNLIIAHVNYQKRGADSDGDQEFVEKWAKKYGLRFRTVRATIEAHGNFQEQARIFRYQFFQKIVEDEKANFILTAHHENDQKENALFRTFRGASPHAILGMNQLSTKILRPFLSISKETLQNALTEKGFEWRDDVSNFELDYTRNRLRNAIIPTLDTDFPGWFNHLQSKASLQKELIEFVRKKFSASIYCNETNEIILKHSVFNHLSESIIAVIIQNIAEKIGYVISTQSLLQSFSLHQKQKGRKWDLNDGLEAVNYSDSIHYRKRSLNLFKEIQIYEQDLQTDYHFNQYYFQLSELEKMPNFKEKGKLFIDCSQFAFPIRIRVWQSGDRFQPLGFKRGTKLVSDLIAESGLTGTDKQEVFVLEDHSGKILTVLFPKGITSNNRISKWVKLTDRTTRYLEIQTL